MTFLNQVHGQHSAIINDLLQDFFIKQAPKNHKRLYYGLLVVPATVIISTLQRVIQIIEQLVSGCIHLIGAVFSNQPKKELLETRNFFLIEFPSAIFFAFFYFANIPLAIIYKENQVFNNVSKFETKSSNEQDSASLKEAFKDIENESHKEKIQTILKKISAGIPLNFKDTWSVIFLLSISFIHKIDPAKLKNKNESFQNDLFLKSPQTAGSVILYYAAIHGISISKKTSETIKNSISSKEEIKEAIKEIRKSLQIILHPDKTSHLSAEIRKERENQFKAINNAWGFLNN